MRRFLLVAFLGTLGLAAGCGSGGSKRAQVVTLTVPAQYLMAGQALMITANVTDGSLVTWSMSGGGAFSQELPGSIVYTAPLSVASNTNTVVTATTAAGSSAYVAFTVLPPTVLFPNVQSVSVNGGPVAGHVYANGGFTSVTVCAPGTTTCNTIDGVLVDTGSVGLRVLASALPALQGVKDSKGNVISECAQLIDQSFLWGEVARADIKIAGEVAISVPIQSIADPSGFSIPSDCGATGAGINDDTQSALGANGILGIGLEPQDCGSRCAPSFAGGTPPGAAYYSCSGSSCTGAFVPLTQQVTNPVTSFAKDNNGWSLQFDAVNSVAQTVSGSLIFGIQTQSNNGVVNATLFTLNSHDNFTTNLTSTGQSLTESFIDSGSSGLFFPDGDLTGCPSPNDRFFCPSSVTTLSAVNVGANKAQNTIDFSVDNAALLFIDHPADAAFSMLAGPNGSGACSGSTGACSFDWGLPFFYGRNVTGAINGQPFPPPTLGTPVLPPAPWWAYTTDFSGH